jgi:hypothetical protein
VATYSVSLVRRIPASGTTPTLTELGPIKWTDLTVTQECGAPSSMSVTASVDNLDSGVKAALVNLVTSPCELRCYRDASLIHAGHLAGIRIQGRSIQFDSVGLLGYLAAMIRDIDYSATATDQATIVQVLVGTFQALTYGNYGLDTSTLTATGVTRDLNLKGSDLSHLDNVIAEMGKRDNGFDLEVDPSTRQMLMYSPRKGSDLSASIIIDQRSIGDPQYTQTVTLGQVASDVVVSSNSTGGVTLTSSAANTTARASFGRAMMSTSFQDVSRQTTLDEHASRFVTDNSTPLHAITPGLLAVPGFQFGDFHTGDIVKYEYDAGLGLQAFSLRVKTITVAMGSGVERMSVGFF